MVESAANCLPVVTLRISQCAVVVTFTYRRQRGDEGVDVSLLGCLDDLVYGHAAAVVPISYVFRNSAVEEHGLLRHESQLRPQRAKLQRADVAPVHTLHRGRTK